jgi:hypothetical protein
VHAHRGDLERGHVTNGRVSWGAWTIPTTTLKTTGAKSAFLRRVPWCTVVREDSAVVACCGWVGHGVMMDGFVVVDPGPTLVPVSPSVSMVAEGFHGNRGLVP